MDKTQFSPEAIAQNAVIILDSKKGHGIKMLKTLDKTVLADYFVICRGNSNTQVRALAGEVEEKLNEKGIKLLHTEGYNEGLWVVLDYGCVMIHILNRESHEFYKLEKLWGDAEETDITTFLPKTEEEKESK